MLHGALFDKWGREAKPMRLLVCLYLRFLLSSTDPLTDKSIIFVRNSNTGLLVVVDCNVSTKILLDIKTYTSCMPLYVQPYKRR